MAKCEWHDCHDEVERTRMLIPEPYEGKVIKAELCHYHNWYIDRFDIIDNLAIMMLKKKVNENDATICHRT